MSTEIMQTTGNTLVTADQVNDFRKNCQTFIEKLNALPSTESIDKTPDGKASTILISHIEMLLDEYFFGLWETIRYGFRFGMATAVRLRVIIRYTGQQKIQ